MRMVFERWKSRKLTIFGKILIIKSLATSKIIHTMSILSTPESVLKDIEQVNFNFIWDANDRIKRRTLIGDKKHGGVKMLDIYCKNKALKASWIKRIHEKCITSDFIDMFLEKFGINKEYLVKTHITSVKQLIASFKLPKFWAEMFCYTNECKSIKNLENMSDYDFLTSPIWFNNNFTFNEQTLYMSNWTKSNILYVRDLINVDGNLITEPELLTKLNCKRNWIREYFIVKNVFINILENFNTNLSNHVKIRNRWTILVNNNIHSLKTQKSKFFYEILVKQKFIPNYMEEVWHTDFDLIEPQWSTIYKSKIWDINDRKLAEFNYKVICNIIYTRSKLSKWNKQLSDKCVFCEQIQDTKHLLFDCPRVKNAWVLIGSILNMSIRYKHIVLGDTPNSSFIKSRNLVINYISYSIYKMWILSENKELDFINCNLLEFIKQDLFKRTLYNNCKYFHILCDKILNNL